MFHAAHNRIIITSSDRNPSVLASRLYFEYSNELQQKTTTNHGLLNGRANPEEIYLRKVPPLNDVDLLDGNVKMVPQMNEIPVDANRIRW